MTQLVEQPPVEQSGETDLAAAVHRVLAASAEPLTLSKIRASLPARLRPENLEELATCLHRQVAANVLYQYPKYRSQQDRFWDRAMPVHIAGLLRTVLAEGPLAWFELRRKLPAYALPQAEEVLRAQLSQGLLFLHPPASKRGGERYSVHPPDPKDFLRSELAQLFSRLEQLGFSQAQLRAGALELLHDEEWSAPQAFRQTPPAAEQQPPAPPDSDVLGEPLSQVAADRPPAPQTINPIQTRPPDADDGPTERRAETAPIGSPPP